MTALKDLAQMVRSKNAGPFMLTFDVMFDADENYTRVKESGVINEELFHSIFGTPVDQVRVFHVDAAKAIKITIPRPAVQGDLDDTDGHGGQQFPPLIYLEIPERSTNGEQH